MDLFFLASKKHLLKPTTIINMNWFTLKVCQLYLKHCMMFYYLTQLFIQERHLYSFSYWWIWIFFFYPLSCCCFNNNFHTETKCTLPSSMRTSGRLKGTICFPLLRSVLKQSCVHNPFCHGKNKTLMACIAIKIF